MFRIFSNSSVVGYVCMLVLLVLLRLKLLASPSFYVVADTPDMYSPFWTSLLGHVVPGSTLSAAMAVIGTMLCAMIVNNLVNRYRLMPVQSCLGGFFFVVLSGAFRPAMGFQPVMVFALAFVWCLDRLFSAMRKDRPYLSVAWGFGIATAGALVWTKGMWFLLFLFVVLPLLRLSSMRCVMAAVLGMLSSLMIGFTSLLFMESPSEAMMAFVRSMVTTLPYWKIGSVSIVYLVVMTGYIVIAVLDLQRHILEVKISESRRFRVAEWTIFFAVLLFFLPGFSYELQILVAVGASLILPRFVYGLRSYRMQEVAMLLLTGVTAWMIY